MKKILVLNDFPIFPVDHGGKVRIFNIYSGLSQYFDITYVCFTKETTESIKEINPCFREISIPYNFLQRFFLNYGTRLLGVSCDDVLVLFTGILNQRMKKVLRKYVNAKDAVIFIHPYMCNFLKYINKSTKIFHESLNVEYLLKKSIYPENLISSILLNKIKVSEKSILEKAMITFSVSDGDATLLSSMYSINANKIKIAPNGVDIHQYPEILNFESKKKVIEKPLIVFLGSGHMPNVTAARQIITKIAPQLPQAFFLIIGSVCYSIHNELIGRNVGLGYQITDDEKVELFLSADIAINPMMSGSGTNLKMLDYMAAGLPVITTPIGARGLNLKNKENVIICEINDFSSEIINLHQNIIFTKTLAQKGYVFVRNNYSWDNITEMMYRSIQGAFVE